MVLSFGQLRKNKIVIQAAETTFLRREAELNLTQGEALRGLKGAQRKTGIFGSESSPKAASELILIHIFL